jgi:tetratricopeptide (TPR) repeat protein
VPKTIQAAKVEPRFEMNILSYKLGNEPTRASVILIAAVVALAPLMGCAQKNRKSSEADKVLTHVVAQGETLEDIADGYYGDPARASDIRKFNDLTSNELSAGEEVRVFMSADDLEALGLRKRARRPYNAGLELAERGSYLDATVKFREAVDLDPDFAEARYNLGVTYQKLDAHDKAIEQFKSAIDLRTDNPLYYYALGNSYFHLERYDRAASEFRRALKIDTRYLKAQYSLAVALEKAGKSSRAAKEWRRYLELDSDSLWAERARARLAEIEP